MTTLKAEFPSLGWKQILTVRKKILDSYDVAREQARAHEVQTFHGKVAEGACRDWLTAFLPRRYGVTSGYVVSPGLSSAEKIPHFDVIIYDQLESPVLWVEESPDVSLRGRSLAVPVEYVRAVLEIKSALCASTMRDALEHLRDLFPLMQGADASSERYKLHLPANFFCGLLFMELRKEDAKSELTLSSLTGGLGLRGFAGGVVLRGEGHTLPQTGRLMLAQSESPIDLRQTPLLEFGMSSTIPIAEKVHIGATLVWSEAGFAMFAFDLVAMLQGTYEVGRVSSFYGMGSSYTEWVRDVEAKSAK
jgi:hypothetical protein